MPAKNLFALVVVSSLCAGSAMLSADPPQKVKDKKQQKAEEKAQRDEQKGKKPKKAHHNNGKAMLGEKLKSNGRHGLGKKGETEASVDVRDGKVAGFHAKHDKKGELPVKKYKSTKKMAMLRPEPVRVASLSPFELQDAAATLWIGYSYVDDYGDEQVYWFPVDIVIDGDAGAVDYPYDDYAGY